MGIVNVWNLYFTTDGLHDSGLRWCKSSSAAHTWFPLQWLHDHGNHVKQVCMHFQDLRKAQGSNVIAHLVTALCSLIKFLVKQLRKYLICFSLWGKKPVVCWLLRLVTPRSVCTSTAQCYRCMCSLPLTLANIYAAQIVGSWGSVQGKMIIIKLKIKCQGSGGLHHFKLC